MKKFTASSEQLKPDPKYNSKLVSKFINCLMTDGKKSTAQRAFYDAMDIIERKIGDLRLSSDNSKSKTETQKKKIDDSKSKIESQKSKITVLEVLEKAINNVKPLIEVRSKRIGGASYQIPMQISSKRQQSLAFRWLLQSSRAKKGKPICERLASELLDAYNGQGGAMATRDNIHKMAEANKAFAHFGW